ncbi:glycosyltransferase family 2 protein [Celeribacter naphthalenivorans]|uniref:glycosyltransferase family 2 protein n=1 Tax=Celeribacter naphthalenivorans TaxID=1614694 RepID=UPI001CFC1B54|nr:glycosyltransferase family 2 protein [Celeribacter naphthalenivorans]
MKDFVVSLTTIPPRFSDLMPTFLSLKAQKRVNIREIRLDLPKTYRRFEFDPATDLPDLPDWVTLYLHDFDYGPATKILPSAQAYAGQDVLLFFCDDDHRYEPHLLYKLGKAAEAHPNDVIANMGYNLNERLVNPCYAFPRRFQPRAMRRPKDWRYRLWRLSTGLRKKQEFIGTPGYMDLAEGYGGILARPSFFTPDMYDIPEILWTVDDPWLSGHFTKNGHGIWRSAEPLRHAHNVGAEALADFVYQGHGRAEADTACIEYFRREYGIWGGDDPATRFERDLSVPRRWNGSAD